MADRLKKKLQEAANANLSSTGSELDSREEADSPLASIQSGLSDNDVQLEFASLSSGTNEQLIRVLDEHMGTETRSAASSFSWNDSSDPSLDGCIIGLADPERIFHNPFELTDDIRRGMIRRSEASGSRALNWSLSSFDRVGGSNTLRSVWARLKKDRRVKGNKREASDSEESDNERKKARASLEISSTCLDFDT